MSGPSSISRGEIRAQATGANRAEVRIYGDIGDPWDPESPQAAQVVAELASLDVEHIDVRVNSHGGSVTDGLAIYNALVRHPARVVGHNDGVAASMGSAILMAAEEVVAADESMMMVHAPWGFAMGNASTMRKQASMLDRFAETLTGAYARRVDREVAAEWLNGDEDQWFTAAEAVEAGLVDHVASTVQVDGDMVAAVWRRYMDRSPPPKVAAWARHYQPTGGPPMADTDDLNPSPDADTTDTPPTQDTAAPDPEPSEPDLDIDDGDDADLDDAGTASVDVAAAVDIGTIAARNAEVAAVFEPFRDQPHMAALERFYLTDDKGIRASVDAVRAKVLAKLGEGIEPAGRAQYDEPPQDRRNPAGGATDAAEFDRLVQAHVDDGMARRAAIKRVAAENPDAHLAFVRAANPRHDNVAALAHIDAG